MISMKQLSFRYKKQAFYLHDLCLNIEQGSIVGLLGKNGAGKSTVLKLLAGLIEPDRGKVSVNGYTPFKRNPDFLTDVFMVQEEFSLPSVTIETHVKSLSPFYHSFDKEKLQKILTEFELHNHDKINKLSHGQRKKFLIAFALASNCKLLIFDEPTNGLDIPSKSSFRKILVSSVSDEQLVLISTHQVKDIETIIDKLIVLDDGKILFQDNLLNINKNYHFATATSTEDTGNIIYRETCPLGYKIITTDNQSNSDIDLELLFNAIINQAIPQ